MNCIYCPYNRPQKASKTFYSARCVLGYAHDPSACRAVVGRSEAHQEQGDGRTSLELAGSTPAIHIIK